MTSALARFEVHILHSLVGYLLPMMAAQPDWDQLLQQSEDLAARVRPSPAWLLLHSCVLYARHLEVLQKQANLYERFH